MTKFVRRALLGLLTVAVARAEAPAANIKFEETTVGRVQGLLIDSLQPSPDGRHLAYAVKQNDQTHVALDGVVDPRPYDGIGADGITFSPDSQKVAYLVAVGKQWRLVLGTTPGKIYDTFAKHSMTFSPDSHQFAAVAERDGKRFVVIDGVEGPPYDDVTSFAFSPQSGHYAYVGRIDMTWHVVVDGVESKLAYDGVLVSPIAYSIDGKHQACAAQRDGTWTLTRDGVETACPAAVAPGSVVFSADGLHLGCVVAGGAGAQLIVDEKSVVACDEIAGTPVLGPQTLVVGRRGVRWSVLIDGQAEKDYDKITSSVAVSSDCKRVGFAATRGGRALVVIDGKEIGPFDEILEGPIFSVDGGRAGFIARREHQQFWSIDGTEGPPGDAAGRLVFGPDGHFACGIQQGGDVHLIMDGSSSQALGGFLRGARIAFDDKGGCSTLGFRGGELLRVEGHPPMPETNRSGAQ